MAMVLTFRLPQDVCQALAPNAKGAALRDAIKALLEEGVRDKTPISTMDVPMHVPTERFNLSVPEDLAVSIRSQAADLGVTPRHICQGTLLAMTAGRSSAPVAAAPGLDEVIGALSRNGRPVTARAEQARFHGYLLDAMESGSIGLCEAGTGTGKTLAMLSSAKRTLEANPNSRLVIACPTLMLMEQFARQYDEMTGAGIAMPELRAVVGRREFVSPAEVLRVAESGKIDPEVDIDAVLKWVDAGGPAEGNHWLEHPWLAGALARIAPAFPVQATLLPDTADQDDPGYQSYRDQFRVDEDGPSSEIVLCTHSMLAVDIRRRMLMVGRDDDYRMMQKEIGGLFESIRETEDREGKQGLSARIAAAKSESLRYGAEISRDVGALPAYHYLLVDEAHILEQAFSNALSNYVSLYSFWRGLEEYRARGGKIAAKSIAHVASQMKSISALASMSSGDTVSLDGDHPASRAAAEMLREMCNAASIIASSRNDQQDPNLARLKRELKMMCSIGERRAYTRAYIQFSPVRAFPRIFMGAPSVEHALSFLWAGVRGGACVSATLYLPRGDGFSSGYQAGLLAVPKDRRREYRPVVPEWTFSTVKGVYFPEALMDAGRPWLRPPSRLDKLPPEAQQIAEKRWLGEVANAIARIHSDAAGGVLVLMTSYAAVETLTALLPPDIRKTLVAATPDLSLSVQRHRYLAHVHHGRKPVWLAVGAAWTGLDVGGHQPWKALYGAEIPETEDNVVTDLVIPRIPFGTNRTMTHLTRLERNSTVPWEILDAVFRIKQGMGRLVRRGGLPANRRIFILDGRINDPMFSGYLSRIKALVTGYATSTLRKSVG